MGAPDCAPTLFFFLLLSGNHPVDLEDLGVFAPDVIPFVRARGGCTRRREHLAANGRTDEAAPLFAEARGTLERLAAKPWLDRLTAAETAPPHETAATAAG